MTRRSPASETSKRMRAKQAFALERRELRQPSEAREAPASPTSFPIKTEDPAVRAMIDEALPKREANRL